MTKTKLRWKVHTTALLKEILSDPYNGALMIPLNILRGLLCQVAQRAIELDDPQLNALMIRLTLYSISDPTEPDYNSEIVAKILEE